MKENITHVRIKICLFSSILFEKVLTEGLKVTLSYVLFINISLNFLNKIVFAKCLLSD